MEQTYEVYLQKEKIFPRMSDKKQRKNKGKTKNDISDIFTSEHMENISLVSWMYFHVENTSCLFFGKTLTHIYVIIYINVLVQPVDKSYFS